MIFNGDVRLKFSIIKIINVDESNIHKQFT